MLPEEFAIVYVPRQQQDNSLEVQRNNLADKAAKEATFHLEIQMLQTPSLTPVYTPQEKLILGSWVPPRPWKGNGFSNPIMRAIPTQLHQGIHWGVRLCVMSSSEFMCVQKSI
jgi:hypothetical protein